MLFYCICVKRKNLWNYHSSFFFFFSFSSLFLDRLAKDFLQRNYCAVIHDRCDQDWTCSHSRQDFGWTALSFLAKEACDQDLTHSLNTLKSLFVKSVPEVAICNACGTWHALNTVTSIHSIQKAQQAETQNNLASQWMAKGSLVKTERNQADK